MKIYNLEDIRSLNIICNKCNLSYVLSEFINNYTLNIYNDIPAKINLRCDCCTNLIRLKNINNKFVLEYYSLWYKRNSLFGVYELSTLIYNLDNVDEDLIKIPFQDLDIFNFSNEADQLFDKLMKLIIFR